MVYDLNPDDSRDRQAGESFFRVELPESNRENSGFMAVTSEGAFGIDAFQRVIGGSGVDYFNPNGSSAGRILDLTRSERNYLDSIES